MGDARISVVDYEEMPRYAGEMRGKGEELNRKLKDVYNNVSSMHECWYGKRYNELVKSFNEIIPQLNDILSLVVTEIPSTLEKVANNYSQVDRGENVTSVSNEECDRITEIAQSNDVGMRFMASNVENTKNQVKSNFENANADLNEIQSIFSRVNWESDAATAFKERFNSLKNQISQSFENLNNEFTKQVTDTINDMATTESANTVQ